jgi:hypothetical protein
MIRRRIIQGDPIRVGQKQVVPEAQVTWWMQRRATIGMNSVWSWGAGAVNIEPRALIERDLTGDRRERRVPIRDETARLLIGLAAGMLFVWFLAEIAIVLATPKEVNDVAR